jgi:hypothetical protein
MKSNKRFNNLELFESNAERRIISLEKKSEEYCCYLSVVGVVAAVVFASIVALGIGQYQNSREIANLALAIQVSNQH